MKAFWRSLETAVNGGTRLEVWDRVLGDSVSTRFLLPVGGIVGSVGCVRTLAGHNCRYRIVEHDDGDVVGVCDEGYCARRSFTREDLAKFDLDADKIARGLSHALNITPGIRQLGYPGINLAIGSLPGTKQIPVLLCRQFGSDELERFLANYFAEQNQAILLLLPTARRLSDRVVTILRLRDSHYFVLEDNLELQGAGAGFELSDAGRSAWRDCVDLIVGAGSTELGFAIPPNARWQSLAIKFKDRHTVAVSINRRTKMFSYSDMGMIDKRNNLPDAQWQLLAEFAFEYGYIDWNSRAAGPKNQKRKERLAAKLKQFFKIEGDPFIYNKDTKGWDTVFTISSD